MQRAALDPLTHSLPRRSSSFCPHPHRSRSRQDEREVEKAVELGKDDPDAAGSIDRKFAYLWNAMCGAFPLLARSHRSLSRGSHLEARAEWELTSSLYASASAFVSPPSLRRPVIERMEEIVIATDADKPGQARAPRRSPTAKLSRSESPAQPDSSEAENSPPPPPPVRSLSLSSWPRSSRGASGRRSATARASTGSC